MTKIRKDNIKIPSGCQLCVLVPFALLYTIFIIFGNLEKAAELSAVQNIGRILL